MKILSTEQIRSADAYTIAHEPIPSIDLMERASRAFVEAYLELPVPKSVAVVCGQGNNGGDGLAIARLLTEMGHQVRVYMVKLGPNYSADCEINLNRWLEIGPITEVGNSGKLEELQPDQTIIDAMFGSGISRGITGKPAKVIESINGLENPTVAVDMPSGLFADAPNPEGAVIQADFTLTFQSPKLAFFLPENRHYTGEWMVLDIGLDQAYIEELSSRSFVLDDPFIKGFGKHLDKFAHKGTFGHALLVAGSKGKIGAAVLSTRAALRGGLGLISVHIPACGYQVLQTAVPEAMCLVDNSDEIVSEVVVAPNISAVGLGPGLGTDATTVKAIRHILESFRNPLVIDADGLNILSENRELLDLLPTGSILTPHPREFQRLTGKFQNDYHRLQLQQEFAEKYQVIMVYKGAHTTVCLPSGDLYFNSTGNPGMATGGSGDVLTGLILGLLTRTGDPRLAALVGVYMHGLAGDLAAEKISITSLIASDIIEHIGGAIKITNLPL